MPTKIPNDIWNLIEPLPPHLRAVGNFVNALRSGTGDLMLFEDDIAIKPGWMAALDAHDVIWGDGLDFDPEGCFISLYSNLDLRSKTPLGALVAMPLKPIKCFYGTLGLFIPAKHRQPLADAAMAVLQDASTPADQRRPFDGIVSNYINEHPECSLAITIPSFVDHRGDVSVINPTHGIRRAPMF